MDTSDRADKAAAIHDLGRACQDFLDLELSGNNKPVGPPIQAWHDLSDAAMRAGAPSGIVKRIAFPRTLHPVPIDRAERGAPAAYDVSNWTAGFILYGQESTRVELLAAVSDLVAWCDDRLAAGLQAKPRPPGLAEQSALADVAANKTPATRTRARRRQSKPRVAPLTHAQRDAAELVGANDGNVQAAADAAGRSRQAMGKLYKKAMNKLGEAGVRPKKPKMQALPTDRRGQADVSDRE